MNSNAFRLVAGYSRFLLQEERRHDLRTGVFLYQNLRSFPFWHLPKVTPYFKNYNYLQDPTLGVQNP